MSARLRSAAAMSHADIEPRTNVSREVGVDLIEPVQALPVRAQHRLGAKGEKRRCSVGEIVTDLLDRRPGLRQTERGLTAKPLQLTVHAYAGDVGAIGEPQARERARARDRFESARPWRHAGQGRVRGESGHGVEHQGAIGGAARHG